jgi:hypothetical protein
MTGCNCGEMQCVCTQIFNAYATSTGSAYTRDGQLVTSSASATASSSLSYEDAYQIALQTAQDIANQNAVHDANVINEANPVIYYASKSATGSATTNSGQVITASATATATSTLSQSDADTIASNNAQSIANQTAQNDVNIINQSFPKLVSLTNLSGSSNRYDVSDNTNNYYIKGSTGNSTSMTPTFFSLGSFTVTCSAVDSKGNLYIGGSTSGNIANQNGYSSSDGLFTLFNYVAMWNGSTWSTLGNGLGAGLGAGATVSAIAIDSSDNVYVGGGFTTLGTSPGTVPTLANGVAKWTPSTSSWSVLGNSINNGVDNVVSALAVDSSNNLYVGGDFTNFLGNFMSSNSTNTEVVSTSTITFASASSSPLAADMYVYYSGSPADLKINTVSSQTSITVSSSSISIPANTDIYFSTTYTSANRIAKWDPSTSTWSSLGTSALYNGVT